jgi:hypothetical protein
MYCALQLQAHGPQTWTVRANLIDTFEIVQRYRKLWQLAF